MNISLITSTMNRPGQIAELLASLERQSLAPSEIVAFPDDDCLYPPQILAQVARAFDGDQNLDIYTGMSITPAGVPSQGRWGAELHRIDRFNIWTSQTSYTTFYRRRALNAAGRFDESLGWVRARNGALAS